MLDNKGLLHKYFTQNIDNLEEKAGFEAKNIVQAHGANVGAHCSKCDKDQDREKMIETMKNGQIYRCQEPGCSGPVKPRIIFFGENLRQTFFQEIPKAAEGDLLIVIGTALAVSPFNSLVDLVPDTADKVLINMENTGPHFDFADPEKHPRRLLVKGKCDEVVQRICKDVGWADDLQALIDSAPKAFTVVPKASEEESKTSDQVDQLTSDLGALQIDSKQGEEEKKYSQTEYEAVGPIMGFHAVQPRSECPHCVPGEFIAPIEDFADIKIETPCFGCGHTKENWICL